MAFCKNKLTNIFDFSKLAAYSNVHDSKIEGATMRDVNERHLKTDISTMRLAL
jgi:hypothetical protein